MYNLEYLPIASQDMVNIVRHISREFKNPVAANRIAEKLIEAEVGISTFPYSNPVYIPIRPLKHEYRKLLVQNHLILYWVDEEKKLVTIARVIYAKRDLALLLE